MDASKKKDLGYIALFSIVGMVLAYVLLAPIRRDAATSRPVGTPLRGMEAPQAASAQVYAEGTVRLGKGVSAAQAAGKTLFLIARPAQGGAPVAVQRIAAPAFPLRFRLTAADNMVGEEFFEGDLRIVARLDADGVAGPKQPADWEGSAPVGGDARTVEVSLSPPVL